jgi:isopenicillin N synthase-like dioxygenase
MAVGYVKAATSVIGGGISAWGSINAGNTNQRLAEMDADSLEYRATLVLAKGNEEAMLVRQKGQAFVGSQQVGYASQGVSVATGTAAKLQEETMTGSEEDARQIKLNAARESWTLREQAKVSRYKGDMAKYQSRIDAAGSLLGGIAGAF